MARYPRLRMFAGPNAAGKSTMKDEVPSNLLGLYINADEMEKEAKARGFFDAGPFGITATSGGVTTFLRGHTQLQRSDLALQVEKLTFHRGRLRFNGVELNSYLAAAWADFLRQKLMEKKVSFSFETVMSHPSKVELLQRARQLGYHTYLYYISTEDPEINISRVPVRVSQGGHGVPEDKLRQRYYRSHDLLYEAIRHSDRAYLFDNSSDHLVWFAEFTRSEAWEAKIEQMPGWFKQAVLDKIMSSE